MILVGYRSSEESHEAVAQELIDRALVAVNLGEGQRKEAVEEGMHRFGAKTLRQYRRVHDVAKQHRHLLALAFQRMPRMQDLLDEVRRSVRAWGGRGNVSGCVNEEQAV